MLKLNSTLKEASFSVNDSTQAGIWGWFKNFVKRRACDYAEMWVGRKVC